MAVAVRQWAIRATRKGPRVASRVLQPMSKGLLSPRLAAWAEGHGMTTIKATCPTCGEVELTADDLTLMVCSQAPLSYYAFRCPRCIEEIRKPADDHIISLLISGGVRATNWNIPAEALEEHDGSSISYDELLDFALAVERTDYLAALADHAFRA